MIRRVAVCCGLTVTQETGDKEKAPVTLLPPVKAAPGESDTLAKQLKCHKLGLFLSESNQIVKLHSSLELQS